MKRLAFTPADGWHRLAPAAILMWFMFFAVANAFAADQVVTDPGDGDGANQLRAKLALAQSGGGGTITFNVGTATIVTVAALPPIATSITIDGGNVITLSGENNHHLFEVIAAGTLTLNNLTVTACFSGNGDGGAIRNGSAAGNGGTLNINHCKFLANRTDLSFRGGAILSYGPLNITDSEFANHQAGGGGALYPRFSAAVTTITGCNFHDNTVVIHPTTGWGGAILLWDGASATITASTFSANTAHTRGGAVYVEGSSSLTVSATQFSGNRGQSVTSQGGAINSSGTLSVIDCAFETSSAINGGAIYTFHGATSIARSSFTQNGGILGGAVELGAGTMTVSNSSFNENGYGDTGLPTTLGGGAIRISSGTAVLNNLIITGNVAQTGGGIEQEGTTSIENVTVSGNHAQRGGGINQVSGAITLTNVTLYQNTASSGVGGIEQNGGTVAVTNTIIANNTGGNCEAPIANNAFSLSSDNTCGFGAGRDNVEPMLGPLANNGGFTQTHLPQAGSPAIDNGTDNGASPRDQRGYLRAGVAPDVGAAEFGGTIPVTLANISTRLRVETGDNALIGGFIITGGGAKRVLLRAIGPSLPGTSHLDNPTLELYSSTSPIASNDNWLDAPNRQAIIDSTIAPPHDLESAILVDLEPGSYTAIVRGAGNTAGVGLVEAYDLDLAAGSKLANISTRGLVGTGDNVQIGGFIVLGPDSQRVVVRAIGPSLPVGGALSDPALELRDGNGALIRSNDNWRNTQETEIIATGLPPSNDLDSAIVATLPGNGAAFTTIVRGMDNSTGVALVEVYAVN
jgi:predicted outer membrane repeat protein